MFDVLYGSGGVDSEERKVVSKETDICTSLLLVSLYLNRSLLTCLAWLMAVVVLTAEEKGAVKLQSVWRGRGARVRVRVLVHARQVLECVALWCGVVWCDAAWCSVVQGRAVCCSVA